MLRCLQDWLIIEVDVAVATEPRPRVFDQHVYTVNRQTVSKASLLLPLRLSTWRLTRAVAWLQEEKSLDLVSGCALFAALYKEDLTYSQHHEPVNPKPVLLNLNPKETFLSWPQTGQAVGIISWTVARWSYRFFTMDPTCVWRVKLGIDRATLRQRKRIKETRKKPRCHHPLRPETLGGGAWRSSGQAGQKTSPPVRTSETETWIGFFGGCGRITSKPPQIPAAVELDELKELYKQKNTKKT